MKIEKINDNQIRCTLTRADLAARELKISELACGTEKAKSLFQDMMQQASVEFGFEAEDMPLMIEAIPSSADTIVLIITKVDNPDELDSKFAKFASDMENKKQNVLDKLEGAEDILDLLNKVKEAVSELPEEVQEEIKKETQKAEERQNSSIRLFSFATIDDVIRASQLLNSLYEGSNTLYKDTANDTFVLALTRSEHSTSDFNKICNMLSEYGSLEHASGAVLAFLEEHCEVYIAADAVQKLAIIGL